MVVTGWECPVNGLMHYDRNCHVQLVELACRNICTYAVLYIIFVGTYVVFGKVAIVFDLEL